MGYVEDFAKDVSYYDSKDKEVKAIINSVNLKDKVLLDAGQEGFLFHWLNSPKQFMALILTRE